jgi:predicted aspartyl protease
MGITYVTLELANPSDPSVTETLDFLVDSGATYTVVPSEVLDRLGIQPLTEDTFRLANGEVVSRR